MSIEAQKSNNFLKGLPGPGSTGKSFGKTEARQEFLRLVDEIQVNQQVVTITDRGVPVAVLLNYKQAALLAHLLSKELRNSAGPDLKGTIKKAADIDKSSRKAAGLFHRAAKKTADSL